MAGIVGTLAYTDKLLKRLTSSSRVHAYLAAAVAVCMPAALLSAPIPRGAYLESEPSLEPPVNAMPYVSEALSPGQEFYVRSASGHMTSICTLAFLVQDTNTKQYGMLTAGHCGESSLAHVAGCNPVECDEQSTLVTQSRTSVRTFSNGNIITDIKVVGDAFTRDIALIYINTDIEVSSRMDGRHPLGAVVTAAELERLVGERICKIGATTGVTCGVILSVNGEFVTAKNHQSTNSAPVALRGDSGGPMFMFDEHGRVRPVAVVSHGDWVPAANTFDPTIVHGQLIAPVLDRWNLELVRG